MMYQTNITVLLYAMISLLVLTCLALRFIIHRH